MAPRVILHWMGVFLRASRSRRRRLRRPRPVGPIALGVLGVAFAWVAPVEAKRPQTIESFALLDHQGRFHQLGDYRDRTALVLFVQGNGCPIVRNTLPTLTALEEEFSNEGVAFLLLNANPQDDRTRIAAEAREFGISLPILVDETQLVAEGLGLTRTAEALLIDPRSRRVAYRGPVDDRLDYQAQRPVREHYLRDAIRALLSGAETDTAREAPGCLIQMAGVSGRARDEISYSETIAPLLARRCRTCHRPRGTAPWAMTDYETIRGWSPMMREMVRTMRMPPWHADPHVARFANEIALSVEEKRTLVHWIEAGSPRGSGPDPLAETVFPEPEEWSLGPPSLVLEIPEQQLPATGIVPYRYDVIDVPVTRDLWVRGADLQPSNPRAMHHGLAWIVYPRGHPSPAMEGPRFTTGMFASYVPGRDPKPLPDGCGYFVPAGSTIRLQLHYTTTGRPEVDRPRLALYVSDEPLAHELKTGAIGRLDFEIPPGAREHESAAELTIRRDILVYALSPHMHYRGKRMAIEAEYPDGRVEPLLSVPRYDFNWQRQYVLEPPLRIPAGTTLRLDAAFDNSEHNPANPDPQATVRYGEQSFEEMLFGYFVYRDL